MSPRLGKVAAQAAHASAQFLWHNAERGCRPPSELQWEWRDTGMKKVVTRVDSLEELEEIFAKAEAAGMMVHKITDSGLTEFHGIPTITILAIGPDYSDLIDPITKHLKLL